MDRPDYDGVKYWDITDLTFGDNYRNAIKKLDTNRDFSSLTDINEIIELFEIYQIITCKDLKVEYSKPYLKKAEGLMPFIARFFKNVNDDNFEGYYFSVCAHYMDDFWALFDKFSCYEQVSSDKMRAFLSRGDIVLHYISEHSRITEAYDQEIADTLRQSDQTARMIVSEFLEEHTDRHKKLYFPKSLSADEYEVILQKYIDSEYPNAGILQLIYQSQSSSECPISDKLRLNAKRRAQDVFQQQSGTTLSFGVGISFCKMENFFEVRTNNKQEILYRYNVRCLEDRLDNDLIIENFATIFAFTDSFGRSRFPSICSKLGVFERTLGVKGVKEYKTGNAFFVEDLRSSAIMHAYYSFLAAKGIDIEEVIKWFFSDYLFDRYGVEGFGFNASSRTSGFVERCKNLCSELDGILKQYKMYVETGSVDEELFEIASTAIIFASLPSQISDKYAYTNSERLKKELYLLFSDQCMLAYIPDYNKYSSFAELIEAERIKVDDYNQHEKPSLDFLIDRHTISVDETGIIVLNSKRASLLRDLNDNDVICLQYCDDYREIIDELELNKDIEIASKLFTKPESDYLNYMLNKSTFSNGLDLRNRYCHGTYSKDENEQARDYFCLLKITIMIVLKIREEFLLRS